MPDYGNRADGTEKGLGFFGELKRPDGQVSTELSVGVNLGGREMEIPLLVPTLSREEITGLLDGGKPSEDIVKKAVDFAVSRMRAGKSVFAGEGDQVPLPPSAEEQFRQGFENINRKLVPNPSPGGFLNSSGGVRG